MWYVVKFVFSKEAGNAAIKHPMFMAKMATLLKDIKAELPYHASVNGKGGGYMVVYIDGASQIPTIAEPLSLWLGATVEFLPVKPGMLPRELAKDGPSIRAAIQRWGWQPPLAFVPPEQQGATR